MDTTPTPITDPVELRHAALAAIKANPASWDQSEWRCDTGMCFAGHVATLAGGTFPYDPHDDTSFVFPDGARANRRNIVTAPDGSTRRIEQFAEQALGLSLGEADRLFEGGNDLDDLETLIAMLDAGTDITYYDDDEF